MPEKRVASSRKLPNLRVLGVFLAVAATVFATPALAHRVLVFAYAEGDTIRTESKFVPAKPVRQGQVQVLEPQTGRVLLTGQTDDKGTFSFKVPAEAAAQKMDLKIVVEAAMGHRGEWLLKAERYLPGAETAGAAAPPAAPAAEDPSFRTSPGSKAAAMDQHMLEEAVNKALERQLAPVKEMLTKLTAPRISLPDIISGIGYILGFLGLWAYFQSKGKKSP